MSERRDAAATATVGLAGTAGAGALRHQGLAASYKEGTKNAIPRPKILAERRMIKHPRGRNLWLAGLGLGAVSLPAAAVGTTRFGQSFKKADDRDSFLRAGLRGATTAAVDRTNTVRERPPAKLVAGNYGAGAAIGSAAGGLSHLVLGRHGVPGAARSAIASTAGVLAGTGSLPVQSKITQRASRGRYEVTPTGVRRRKTKPVKPSTKASTYDGRHGQLGTMRRQIEVGKAVRPRRGKLKMVRRAEPTLFDLDPQGEVLGLEAARVKAANARARAAQMRAEAFGTAYPRTPAERQRFKEIGKMSPRAALRTVGAKAGAHWTVNGLRVADVIDAPARHVIPKTKKGKLVYTGRTKAANAVRSAAFEVASINDKDMMVRNTIHGHPLFGKRADDPGASMSRVERRARVTAAGPPIPVVGDIIQARTAGKLSAAPYRRRAGIENFAGGQVGNVAGMAAGGAGALGLARVSPGFDRRARNANDAIDNAKARARSSVGLRPNPQSMTSRMLKHPKMPNAVRAGARRLADSPAGRAIARNPKVAAVGMLGGGMIGGQVGQQLTYGHIMSRDDRYRARLRKADVPRPMTLDERKGLRRKKNQAAALSLASGVTGLGALGATLGAAATKRPRVAARLVRRGVDPKHARHELNRAAVPLLTAGAGIGGYNSLNYAAIQHREARSVGKAMKPTRTAFPYGKGQLKWLSGNWVVAGNKAAMEHPRRAELAGKMKELAQTNKAGRNPDVVSPRNRYERMKGHRINKALGVPRPRVLGVVRRAPAMRRGFIRQTRLPSGMTRVSSVRGGLA